MRKNTWCAAAVLSLLATVAGAQQGEPPAADKAADDQQYTEKMTEEHKGDQPTPSPASEGGATTEIETRTVAYAKVDGAEVHGFFAKPAGVEGAPGLIVIHEWWGLNDGVRAMTQKLAAEGYAALAVDLYGGRAAQDSDGARALMQEAMNDTAPAEENLRQAFAYLTAQGAPKVGSVGWCFGGGWSLQTALLLPRDLDATIIYYGRVISDRDRLATLQMPILGHFGALDRGIPLEGVHEFEKALHDLGKDAAIYVYDNADHAFANPSGTRYNAEAAELAWQRSTAFLAEHLKK